MKPVSLEQVRRKIQEMDRIPSIPAIVQPLTALLRLPPEQVKLEAVLELASHDAAISAQCLRMANSPLFGRRKTETLRSAILALGLKRVEGILLGCCLTRLVPADQWAMDALIFWRHSMGCALVSQKLAKLIGHPEPDKAYLAGLLHDLGVLVNTLACNEAFAVCLRDAAQERVALDLAEQKHLGFTHCQTGRMLAEQWSFPSDVVAAIAHHHRVESAATGQDLVSLVHLSDLLCRLRDLGYGYYEAVGVDLTADPAWAVLMERYPKLAVTDIARLTMDIDGAMDEITTLVDAVFKPQPSTV